MHRSSENFVGKILDRLPAVATRHLTILQCAKYALTEAVSQDNAGQSDAACGANDAAMAILHQLGKDPIELKMFGRIQGVRLKKSLFEPIKGLDLDPKEHIVYQAALNTAEVQLRQLYDSDRRYSGLL